jgi:hypothetical protein
VRNAAELVEAVQNAFWKLPSLTLENTFLTLQKVLECAIRQRGGNQYKLSRVKTALLRRRMILSENFRVTGMSTRKDMKHS